MTMVMTTRSTTLLLALILAAAPAGAGSLLIEDVTVHVGDGATVLVPEEEPGSLGGEAAAAGPDAHGGGEDPLVHVALPPAARSVSSDAGATSL